MTKYTKRYAEESMKTVFDFRGLIHYADQIRWSLCQYRTSPLLIPSVLSSAESCLENGIRIEKQLIEKYLELEKKYSPTFLESSGIAKLFEGTIKNLEASHKLLCLELISEKPWGKK